MILCSRNIMIVGISCGVVATICFHLIVQEDTSEAGHSEEEETREANPGVMSWLLNPNLYFVACVYMATRLYVNLTQAYIPFYLQVMNDSYFLLSMIYLF